MEIYIVQNGLVVTGPERPTFQGLSFDARNSDGRLAPRPVRTLCWARKRLGPCLASGPCRSSRIFGRAELYGLACPELVGGHVGSSKRPFWSYWLSRIFLEGKRQFDLTTVIQCVLEVIIMEENPEACPEAATAEVVQMPLELSPLYRWVAPDVLGAPPILSQAYMDELKESGVIFGGVN
ncbi:hypothetical protein PIB30_033229 [Stylosanthes scabra]|uniref:Uncharacterized protein n=1 Tax=Stylosanthes scabra TaxID=79078 RepID=A0ABU6VAF7_9FABA|nr:hypothetical protein [Stylosanthes scabra]